ncbi:MAG: FecR domain-containing protein [Mediterranea sp.]|jgi:ferric-dicitrate binding protein FerR (iron transport regulator)|nr:FecR domain-containing protein [Mediterranea sp.]
MKEIEKKCLDFVLRHYKFGRFDTNKAIRRFEEKNTRVHTGTNYRPYWYSGIATTILLCVTFSFYFYNTGSGNDWTKLASGNAIETFLLPDSTAVTLSPRSTLSYQSSDFKNERQVNITGKAFFEVTKDEKHPFEICGQLSRVTVLGTRFQVSESSQKSNVYVVSGKVLFAAKEQAEGVILTGGMEATLTYGKLKPEVVSPGSVNQTAWATQTFIFDNSPVAEVLSELSDFYHVQLTTDDTGKNLNGEFATNSLDEIIDLIENVLQIKIQKND